jgi:single-strand DNA-binding protein
MMPSLNKVMLMGRITHDPELKRTQTGMAVCNLSLAINEQWRDNQRQTVKRTTFVKVTCWSGTAEAVQKYLKKGSELYVDGRLTSNAWQDRNGQKRSELVITADRVQFLTRPNGNGTNNAKTQEAQSNRGEAYEGSSYEAGSDSVPF